MTRMQATRITTDKILFLICISEGISFIRVQTVKNKNDINLGMYYEKER